MINRTSNMLKKILFILLCNAYSITYSYDCFEDAFNQLFNNINIANGNTIVITNTQHAIAIINNEQYQTQFIPVENENFIVITSNENTFLNKKRKRTEDK